MVETQPSKQDVRRFWGNRPCGVVHSRNPVSTPEFFRDTEAHRFKIHLDWDRPFLRDAVGFARVHGLRVLEVGCGIGVDALEWGRAGNHVVGVDLNLPSCQITRDRFDHAGCPGTFLNADAEKLPFADASFDLIYSFGVLHHTLDTHGAIREIHRCLKPGGTAIVMLYYRWSAMLWGDVVVGYGLRRGGFLKVRSLARLISRYTEWDSQTRESVNPLTKVYSKREARQMFAPFSTVATELHFLARGHFGPLMRLLPLVPAALKRRLHRVVGWNLLIRAVK